MNELSDKEKMQLGHQAFEAFLEKFKPLDNYSIAVLEVILQLLMTGKLR